MMNLSCEQCRDRLPEYVAGSLSPAQAEAVHLHLGACAACRAEGDVVAALFAAQPSIPAGLEARVLRAVAARPVAPAQRVAPRALAMAATMAAAVLGGALLWQALPARPAVTPDTTTVAPTRPAASYAQGVEDPLMQGGSVLPELTESELEALLSKLES